MKSLFKFLFYLLLTPFIIVGYIWCLLPFSKSFWLNKAIKKAAKEDSERIKRGEEPLRLKID